MTPNEAKNVIEKFHKSIKDLRPNAIVQSKEDILYTSARIKYAHFVYGEEIVKRVKITKEIYQEVLESYGIIESLFREDPEPINARYREYLEGLRNGLVTDFRIPNPFGEIVPVNEYRNFLGECCFYEHHTNLLNDNPPAAFIFEALLDKATKEKDIKSLIEIVNTSLTRSVNFPGKKSNDESIFIKLN